MVASISTRAHVSFSIYFPFNIPIPADVYYLNYKSY